MTNLSYSTEEIWAPVKGYEGYYEVSNLGRIRSLSRPRKVFGNPTIRKGRVLTPVVNRNGYCNVLVSVNENKRCISLHRTVAIAFIPNPHNKPQVNHINGNKADNKAENLEWATRKENVRHANSSGLSKYCFGEHKPRAIFTNEQVLLIKKVSSTMTIGETIDLLGLDQKELRIRQTICKIRRGKKYANVK